MAAPATLAAEHYTLSNGLEVVLQPWLSAGQVAVVVNYRVGQSDEPEGFTQLAHLVEHMSFRSSQHLEDQGIFRLLQESGATRTNGVTSFDRTQYFTVVPATALARILWIESERMAFTLSSFNERTLQLEKEIVANELHRKPAQDRFWDRVLATMLGSDAAYIPPVDRLENLDKFELAHVQGFWQRYYRPDNAQLLIVGDIDTAYARKLVELYFASIANPKSEPPPMRGRSLSPTAPSGIRTVQRLFVEDRAMEGQWTGLWWLPPTDTEGEAALDILLELFRTKLREKQLTRDSVAGTATSIYRWGAHQFMYVNLRALSNTNPGSLEIEVRSTLNEVFESGFPNLSHVLRDVTIAKMQRAQDPLYIAGRLESSLLQGQPLYDVNTEIAALSRVDEQDLLALRPVFSDERGFFAWLQPSFAQELPKLGKEQLQYRVSPP